MADWLPNSANGSKGSKRYGLVEELFDVDTSRGLDRDAAHTVGDRSTGG